MDKPQLGIDQAMQAFAGGSEKGSADKMDEYAGRILAGERVLAFLSKCEPELLKE